MSGSQRNGTGFFPRCDIPLFLLGIAFCAVITLQVLILDHLANTVFFHLSARSTLLWKVLAVFPAVYFLFLLFPVAFYWHLRKDGDEREELPGCTVIVPAYNEGPHVAVTVLSLLQQDYPKDRLQVLAVNDGSVDDTLAWLEKVREETNGFIQVINLEKNCGKKHAIASAIPEAKYDFIVTVDSDSIVKPDALKHLMRAFSSPEIGAVAGKIRAKKDTRNFYVRMLDVALIFSCEFMKKAQSAAGTVFCTPGALSAYRKSALLPIVDEWTAQCFLGKPSRIGEDRAIVTLLMREGWHVIYEGRALAETCLPGNYPGLCRMLLRWNRSDIRENFLMASFLLKRMRRPSARDWVLFFHWLGLCVNMVLPFFLYPLLIAQIIFGNTPAVLLYILFSVCVWSMLPWITYEREYGMGKALWALVFGFFGIFAISWIPIWSFFTMRNSQWLTRKKRPGHAKENPAVSSSPAE